MAKNSNFGRFEKNHMTGRFFFILPIYSFNLFFALKRKMIFLSVQKKYDFLRPPVYFSNICAASTFNVARRFVVTFIQFGENCAHYYIFSCKSFVKYMKTVSLSPIGYFDQFQQNDWSFWVQEASNLIYVTWEKLISMKM